VVPTGRQRVLRRRNWAPTLHTAKKGGWWGRYRNALHYPALLWCKLIFLREQFIPTSQSPGACCSHVYRSRRRSRRRIGTVSIQEHACHAIALGQARPGQARPWYRRHLHGEAEWTRSKSLGCWLCPAFSDRSIPLLHCSTKKSQNHRTTVDSLVSFGVSERPWYSGIGPEARSQNSFVRLERIGPYCHPHTAHTPTHGAVFKVCRDGRNPEGDVVVKRTRESSDKPLPDEWFTHRDRIRAQ
jgi:hypothetical protein